MSDEHAGKWHMTEIAVFKERVLSEEELKPQEGTEIMYASFDKGTAEYDVINELLGLKKNDLGGRDVCDGAVVLECMERSLETDAYAAVHRTRKSLGLRSGYRGYGYLG